MKYTSSRACPVFQLGDTSKRFNVHTHRRYDGHVSQQLNTTQPFNTFKLTDKWYWQQVRRKNFWISIWWHSHLECLHVCCVTGCYKSRSGPLISSAHQQLNIQADSRFENHRIKPGVFFAGWKGQELQAARQRRLPAVPLSTVLVAGALLPCIGTCMPLEMIVGWIPSICPRLNVLLACLQ